MTTKFIVFCLVLALSGCIYSRPVDHISVYPMPYGGRDQDILAGCQRTLALLIIQSGAYAAWTLERQVAFCEDVRRSFDNKLRNEEMGRT